MPAFASVDDLVNNRAADQRQGITGKADASRLPSFAYKWEQLDPGKIDDAQEVAQYGIDKQFFATRSSNVEQILYSDGKQQLFAVFKAGKDRDPPTNAPRSAYVYFNVPVQVYNRLYYMERSGGSVGKEFWKLIRIKPLAHRYNYKKIRGGERKKGQRVAVKGVYSEYGMPGKNDIPIYARHTEKTMERYIAYHENKRAEAGSARTAKPTGTSRRGKQKTGVKR